MAETVTRTVDEEPFRSVHVAKQPSSRVPVPLISAVWETARRSSQLSVATLQKPSNTPLWNALVLVGVFGQDEKGLRELLKSRTAALTFTLKWIVRSFRPASFLLG